MLFFTSDFVCCHFPVLLLRILRSYAVTITCRDFYSYRFHAFCCHPFYRCKKDAENGEKKNETSKQLIPLQCNFLSCSRYVLRAIRLLLVPLSRSNVYFMVLLSIFAWAPNTLRNELKTRKAKKKKKISAASQHIRYFCSGVSWMFLSFYYIILSRIFSRRFCSLSLSITCNFVKFTLIKPSLIIYDIHKFVILLRWA